MKLNDFYTSFLTGLGLVITEEGYVKLPITDEVAGTTFPATVNKKSLVLPTPENLNKVVSDNVIVFHPLNEDLERGPSKVLEFVRQYARQELEVQIILLITNILRLSGSPELHKKLSPDQAEILDVVKGMDTKAIERVIEKFEQIHQRLDVNSIEKSLVHIYLRRSGKIGDKSYRQVATVTFPIYEQLAEGELNILGVKLSKAAAKAIKDVFEYIFPNIGTKGAYNVGSNSAVAPKFEAIAGAVASLILCINRVIALVNTEEGRIFEECEILETAWMDQIGKFEAMYRDIQSVPMQRGNEGELEIGEGGYNTVDTSEGGSRPPAKRENPAESIRKRMTQSETPPWEHESPRKSPESEAEVDEKVPETRGSHLKDRGTQRPVQGSESRGGLKDFLARHRPAVGMPPPGVVYDPYTQGYQPPMHGQPPYPPVHPGYGPAPAMGYPPAAAPAPQGGGLRSILSAQARYMHAAGPATPHYPPAPGPYDMGQDGYHPLNYYGSGMPPPPRRR